MVVIIEGIDGIGKSSLTKRLSEVLNGKTFNFSKFPAQNELSENSRWRWMDYVHLQTCKLYAGIPESSRLFCDRGTASNSTLRILKSVGKELVSCDDTELFEIVHLVLNSSDCQNLLTAEEELQKNDVLTIVLRPLGNVEWVRTRNLTRPDEPPYSTDHALLHSFDRLYHAWQVATKAPNKTVWVSPSDSIEDVLQNSLKVLTRHFGRLN